jgi:hypothetical protein
MANVHAVGRSLNWVYFPTHHSSLLGGVFLVLFASDSTPSRAATRVQRLRSSNILTNGASLSQTSRRPLEEARRQEGEYLEQIKDIFVCEINSVVTGPRQCLLSTAYPLARGARLSTCRRYILHHAMAVHTLVVDERRRLAAGQRDEQDTAEFTDRYVSVLDWSALFSS